MRFKYRVRDQAGGVIKGQLEAENKNLVIESLLKQNYYILALDEVRQSGKEIELDLQPVGTRNLIVMTRQLTTMITAGLPLLRALSILGEQADNKKLKKALIRIRDDIEEGMSLGEAVARHPAIFSPVYINMIKAGETGGVLEPVLGRLAEHLEREQEINARVKSASIYPAIITIFAILMVFFIITFVMPTFVTMFQGAGVDLPGPTRVLLSMSIFLRHSWIYLFLGIFVLVFLLKRWGRTPSGRLFFDRLYLGLPILGKAISQVAVARFARTMGTLLRSGIPVLQALEVVENVVGNTVIADAIKNAQINISEGDSITLPLEESGVFELMVTQMIAVGEETGALDEMLVHMSDYFEKEVMHMVDNMMAVIEPIMILVVALLVGGIVIATLLPVFEIVNTVGF